MLPIGEPVLLDGALVNAKFAEDVTMYEQLGIPAGVYMFDRPSFRVSTGSPGSSG